MPKKTEVVEMPEELSASEATANINRVPKRMWRKWNQQARFIFNTVFNQTADQKVMKHPLAPILSPSQWDTIRWNAAWVAADAAMDSVKQ